MQFNRSSAVLQSKHFSGLSGCANSNGHRVGQAYHELQLCKARHMMKIVPLTLKVAACKKTQARLGHKESQEYRVNYVCSSWLQSMSKTCMFLPHRFCCFFFPSFVFVALVTSSLFRMLGGPSFRTARNVRPNCSSCGPNNWDESVVCSSDIDGKGRHHIIYIIYM